MLAPISVATNEAVDETGISGVAVETITKSIEVGSTSFSCKSLLAALIAMKEVPSDLSFNILLSFIPVLEIIHSLFVSTIFSKSKFVRTVSGTYPPTLVIAEVIDFILNCS